jgi:hypothetical protein
MGDARPQCCQTAEEADTVRWAGLRWTVALYIDGTGAVDVPAEFCPFCGAKLPPGPDKHHPMRRYVYEKPEELLELYDEATKRAEAAERRADALAAKLRQAGGGE